eukprot:TRINITY_DN45280_c0_g1_i1.p1 TRINITY_DN45280_c0_g1~~TRINITY_DN45280_c0_g1_i1.p1  ORF type:complete len:371 (-),score=81.09 TRINITY_DN45280_c0_g1_i1:81-1193(-)
MLGSNGKDEEDSSSTAASTNTRKKMNSLPTITMSLNNPSVASTVMTVSSGGAGGPPAHDGSSSFMMFLQRDPPSDDSISTGAGFMPVAATGGRGTKRKNPPTGGKGSKDVIIPDVSGRGGTRRDVGLRTLCFRICSILQDRKKLTFENLVFLLRGNHDADKRYRRRVYDTMKVLKATEVIDVDEDEDREVTWKGLPNDVHPHVLRYNSRIESCKKRLKEKRALLEETLVKFVAYQRLLTRNTGQGKPALKPIFVPPSSQDRNSVKTKRTPCLSAPFVVLTCHKSAKVQILLGKENHEAVIIATQSISFVDSEDLVKSLFSARILPWDLKKFLPENYCRFYPRNQIFYTPRTSPSLLISSEEKESSIFPKV